MYSKYVQFIQAVIPISSMYPRSYQAWYRRDISHDVSTMYWQCIGSRAGRLLDGLVLGVVSEVVLSCVFEEYRCNTRRTREIHDEYESGFSIQKTAPARMAKGRIETCIGDIRHEYNVNTCF